MGGLWVSVCGFRGSRGGWCEFVGCNSVWVWVAGVEGGSGCRGWGVVFLSIVWGVSVCVVRVAVTLSLLGGGGWVGVRGRSVFVSVLGFVFFVWSVIRLLVLVVVFLSVA